MLDIAQGTRRATKNRLSAAVHHNSLLSMRGIQERLFTFAFSGLVYAQIWEDPLIDMKALQIQPTDHIVAIASGGCNGMSYLTANPTKITLVDLNAHHIALNKLKKLAATALPDYTTFYQFFGKANTPANVGLYEHYVRPSLDAISAKHFASRDWRGRKRINYFTDNLYRHGLLGFFIATAHGIARLMGARLSRMVEAKTMAEQRAIFDAEFAPIFEKPLIKWLAKRPSALYGLGIPPAQYEALLSSSRDESGMIGVLKARVERLCCDFDLKQNYFAWQAFGRKYEPTSEGSVPPYLERKNFETIRKSAHKIDVQHINFIDFLEMQPATSLDCYVLLDAQDWMTDTILNRLWQEISRTAKYGARVIFRTAGDDTILPGRVDDTILRHWHYDGDKCREMTTRDRSAIYGGFHLYTYQGA